MRLARFEYQNETTIGFYLDDAVIPLAALANGANLILPPSDSSLDFLPGGTAHDLAVQLHERLADVESIPIAEVSLLVPIPQPPKLMLPAGNPFKPIEEFGCQVEGREKTFPFVFMKSPGTVLSSQLRINRSKFLKSHLIISTGKLSSRW